MCVSLICKAVWVYNNQTIRQQPEFTLIRLSDDSELFILLGSVSTFWLKDMLLAETCFSETTLLLSLLCETTLLRSLSPASEDQDGKRVWKLPVPMVSPDERWVLSWLGWLLHLHSRCIFMPLASLARQPTYGRNSGWSFQEWMGFALCVCKEIWCRLVHESVGIYRTRATTWIRIHRYLQ